MKSKYRLCRIIDVFVGASDADDIPTTQVALQKQFIAQTKNIKNITKRLNMILAFIYFKKKNSFHQESSIQFYSLTVIPINIEFVDIPLTIDCHVTEAECTKKKNKSNQYCLP